MRDREWCILHSSLCLERNFRSLSLTVNWGQALIWLGVKCPRHRAIWRRRFHNVDCRLSRARWHAWTGDIWGYGTIPPQVCERCSVKVGDWSHVNEQRASVASDGDGGLLPPLARFPITLHITDIRRGEPLLVPEDFE